MALIDTALEHLLAVEGGYSDNPADRGGPTNYGITEQVARAYGYRGSMQTLPKATALDIYRTRYWTRPGFNQVSAIYPKLAAELFDTGVNMGPKIAAYFFQRVLNVLNRQHADYADIAADGDIGPMTIAALKGFAEKRGADGEQILLHAVDALQGARYIEIAEANPSQEAFMYGWLKNRIGAD